MNGGKQTIEPARRSRLGSSSPQIVKPVRIEGRCPGKAITAQDTNMPQYRHQVRPPRSGPADRAVSLSTSLVTKTQPRHGPTNADFRTALVLHHDHRRHHRRGGRSGDRSVGRSIMRNFGAGRRQVPTAPVLFAGAAPGQMRGRCARRAYGEIFGGRLIDTVRSERSPRRRRAANEYPAERRLCFAISPGRLHPITVGRIGRQPGRSGRLLANHDEARVRSFRKVLRWRRHRCGRPAPRPVRTIDLAGQY